MLHDDPLSLREAAELLGTSPTWISRLKERGELEADDAGKVSRAAVLAMADRRRAEAAGTVREELRTRILTARAEREELKAAKERLKLDLLKGSLIRRDDVSAALAQTVARLNDRLDALPRNVLGPFRGEHDREEVRQALGREVETLRRELKALTAVPDMCA